MKDVFISYKTEEFDEANWVKSTLETNGISCWMAPMCIPGGSSYAVEIPQAIKNCTVFVLLLSEKSQSSKWVPRELDQAINEGKIIMPFMLENCPLKDDFNFYLTNVQRYNAYESKAATMQKMIAEIKAILAPKQPSAPVAPQPSAPVVPQLSAPVTPQPSAPVAPQLSAPVTPQPSAPVTPQLSAPVTPQPSAPVTPQPSAVSPKKKGKGGLALLIAGVAVVACVVCAVVTNAANKVVIAGETFKKSNTGVSLTGKQLTAGDMQQFEKFQQLYSVSLKDCTVDGTLDTLFRHDLSALALVNCQLTQQQLAGAKLPEHLMQLDLSGNPGITDLTALLPEALEDLYSLRISDTGIRDLSAVARFGKLQILAIDRLEQQSLQSLTGCIYLEELYAQGNALTNLTGLENTSLLRRVYLNNNRLEDIAPLSRSAESLTVVQVSHNQLTDITALKNATALRYLCADGNQLTSLDCLTGCTALSGLSMSGNRLAALPSPWKFKGENVYLDVSNNRITSEVIFFGDGGRIQLNVSGNPLSGYSYAKDHTYTYLNLHGTPAQKDPARWLETLLTSATGSNLVLDYAPGMEQAQVETTDAFTTIRLVNCPLEAQVAMEKLLGSYRVKFITAEEAAELTMSLPSDMK